MVEFQAPWEVSEGNISVEEENSFKVADFTYS